MPPMMAPPGAPSLPGQMNGVPRPSVVAQPTVSGSTAAPTPPVGALLWLDLLPTKQTKLQQLVEALSASMRLGEISNATPQCNAFPLAELRLKYSSDSSGIFHLLSWVFWLALLLPSPVKKSATLSIDDFYLTAEGQANLREANPGNALLEFRGNAGSHDLPFSMKTLSASSKLKREGESHDQHGQRLKHH
ncbi:D-glycerate kinase [Salix suchowensis]|nr:D-glycerate kinase [Salix suchowensis]